MQYTTSKISTRVIFSLVVFLFMFSMIRIPTAQACLCNPPGSPRIEIKKSDAVFTGKVKSIETNTVESELWGEIAIKSVVFEVERSWKNISSREVTITTPKDDAVCGYNFLVDESYLVYAFKSNEDGTLIASLCSRTNFLAGAQEDINKLGDGVLITYTGLVQEKSSQNSAILFTALGIVIASGVFMIMRKRVKNKNFKVK